MIGLALFSGCAPSPQIDPPLFSPAPVGLSTGYEPLPILDAREILPPELLKSEYHTVLDQVVPFRSTYHFSISSPFGQFEAFGLDMLRIRIQEIQALAKMEHISRIETFGEGALRAALSPVQFLHRLATHPLETLVNVPKGIWKMITRIEEMGRGRRGVWEDSESHELIGFSRVKRLLAHQFGVDVYSSNPILQKKLSQLAWANYAGDAGIRMLTLPVTGPAGAVLLGTSWSTVLDELLRDNAPEDLRRMNRDKLTAMGISEELREAFLNHPWYSPRHETYVVHALAQLKGVRNREAFFRLALTATFEEDALFYQRMAEMLAAYHRQQTPIVELVGVQPDLLLAHTATQRVVTVLPETWLPWTRDVASKAEAVQHWAAQADPPRPTIELWVAGSLTPQAAQQFSKRGVIVYEQALARLLHRDGDHEPSSPRIAALVTAQ
ncbi:MAG: hypothetical protein D6704_07665 [Nitrospirae bacterium]|nr:MAG: hypothetical protein D6704_07665 [Nitrospirota bacterium]